VRLPASLNTAIQRLPLGAVEYTAIPALEKTPMSQISFIHGFHAIIAKLRHHPTRSSKSSSTRGVMMRACAI